MGLIAHAAELYQFAFGAARYAYTSASRAVTYQGLTYQPVKGLQRGRLAQAQELSRSALEITVPSDFELLALFRPSAPSQRVTLTLMSLPDRAGTAKVRAVMVVAQVEETTHGATLRCQGLFAALGSLGLRRNWQVACPLVLYSAGPGGCNAPRTPFQEVATVSGVSGNTVSAAAFAAQPDGWFTGGYLEWSLTDRTERRFVTAHTGDTVTLLTPANLSVGQVVSALPGCDHTLGPNGCKRFSNVPNYGGQPWIPRKNPFGNEPIY